MRKTTLLTAALVTGSAVFAMLPIAHAQAATQTTTPTVEAWYQPNPTCKLPSGCLGQSSLPAQPPVQPPVAVPMSPYPAATMHVAVDGGQETARSYLQFSLPVFDSTLTAATLDVPLDSAQADGSVSAASAKVQVCTFQGSLQKIEGSTDQPPTASCGTSVTATVDPAGTKLHADLAPLVPALSQGAGLVLLPDATSVGPSDAWHVVFSAHDRTGSGTTPPASLTVDLTPNPVQSFSDTPQVPAVPPATAAQPPPLGPVPAPPVAPAQPPAVVNAPQAPAQQPQQPVVPQARTVTVGYAYPTVWLLPLAFLLLVPLVARTLTRDLAPV